MFFTKLVHRHHLQEFIAAQVADWKLPKLRGDPYLRKTIISTRIPKGKFVGNS